MNYKIILILMSLLLVIPAVNAVATLEVSAFSCNPDEVALGDQFSCTATVQNTGDEVGSLTTATLFPDTSNWLEDSSYVTTVNSNINSGASAEVIFSGLIGTKQGDNGFSKILLDDVTDTFVADNSVTVNNIDIVLLVTSSATSAGAGEIVDVTGQAIAGGNVDITVTFSVISGECSIGNQASSSTASGLTDSQTTSHTWIVTLGTSADCVYKITAISTSNPSNVASKSDSVTNTITCTSCTSSSSSSSSSSGGSGGGGGGGASSVQTKKSIILTSIDQNNPAKIENFHKELALTKMEINVYNRKLDVEITIDKLSSNPVSNSLDGSVYKYLTIENQLSDIEYVNFEFEVLKSWITDNNIDDSTVKMYRYTSEWDILSTEKTGSNSTHVFYKAVSPGLSYFAIAGEKKADSVAETASDVIDDSVTEETIEETGSGTAPAGQIYIGKDGDGFEIPDYVLIIIGFLIVLALGWYYYHGHERLAKSISNK